MRRKNSNFAMTKERDQDLMRAYRESVQRAVNIKANMNQLQVVTYAVNSPAARYWVSLERACAIVYKMRKGDQMNHMRENTRKLYHSLYQKYLEAARDHPDTPVKHLIADIIEQPAPCFALTPESASLLISKIKKQQWYIQRHRLLRHLF